MDVPTDAAGVWLPAGIPDEALASARVKFELLSDGLHVDQHAARALAGGGSGIAAKRPVQTRSGVSGGLDLSLPGDVFVNAPVTEGFAAASALSLTAEGADLVVSRDGEVLCQAIPIPEPSYYSERSRDGSTSLKEIGQMCSPDRFCYGITGPGCSFWREDRRCRYCSIGSDANEDGLRKREQHLYEALERAVSDPHWPARHVLLGGGTPPGDDMGALRAAALCEGIKERFGLPVYVMIAAPLHDEHIDVLADAGVDELGMNLEFWSDEAWTAYIPGKRLRIGKERYLEALEHSVRVIGRHRTRSILIAGLEAAEHTLAAVVALADRGVMPIISPFRPLKGSALHDARGFTTEQYIGLFTEAEGIAARAGGFLGPNCVCCQNNTLTLPFGPHYGRS